LTGSPLIFLAPDAGVAERGVEKPAGRAREGLALLVLGVAGLLADQACRQRRRAVPVLRLGW
jgi:hypothetical protein